MPITKFLLNFAPLLSIRVCSLSGNSSVGRARPCQGRGRGSESRFPLFFARMVESVDTRDLKSLGQKWLCGFKSHFEYNKGRQYYCRPLLLGAYSSIRRINGSSGEKVSSHPFRTPLAKFQMSTAEAPFPI